MPRICYKEQRFSAASIAIIEQAQNIVEEYIADGLSLTLRQLYYQFVARGLIENSQKSYKRLGVIISNARLAGLIDWYAIEDRTRGIKEMPHWDTPAEIIRGARRGYHIDMWEGQRYRPEVWIEKDALTGVIADVCGELDVAYFSCRGYASQSEIWRAARRITDCDYADQKIVIIHLGDHDPSGLDMTRDIADRLGMFLGEDRYPVTRLALTMAQVKKHKPPPNPAKVSDSRAKGYIRKHGRSSWELDALDPRTMQGLVRTEVLKYRNEDLFQERQAQLEADRDVLRDFEAMALDMVGQ